MKRLHVHISVKELGKSIAFYSTLFDAQPSVEKNDYAKWMLDDPAVNFAISTSGEKAGLDHLGFQVDSDEALEAVHQQLDAAAVAGHSENEAECCYAKSNKYWTMDRPESLGKTFTAWSKLRPSARMTISKPAAILVKTTTRVLAAAVEGD